MTHSVHLFSAPWMKAGWPCLGIATVKAALGEAGISTAASHFHLETAARLGWNNYDVLSEVWGAGEALFGALIDPEDAPRLAAYASERLRKAGNEAIADWAEGPATQELEALFDLWIDDSGALETPVIGASVGALQLCSSIYLMRRLSQRGHRGVRVLGGSGLVGTVASTVIKRVPEVDYIVNGEGERVFPELVRHCLEGKRNGMAIPGVIAAETPAVSSPTWPPPVDFSKAPSPDLDDYFAEAELFGIPPTALTLSVEHSRGCEWEHREPGQLRGCTFCGLYRNSPNFRRKSPATVARQVRELVNRHRNLNVAFVDAYLPEKERDAFLDGLNELPEDITLFSELRCDLDEPTARKLARRARRVQLGVESFSSDILRRIGKGVSGAHSVYNVRVCQELRIPLQYNLMLGIPGVEIEDIVALAASLPALYGLVPPQSAQFYLDRNSLMFREPEAYGLDRNAMNLDRHAWLPLNLGDNQISQIVSYRHDQDALTAWAQVEDRVATWKAAWARASATKVLGPLTWQGGTGWATVIDMRGGDPRIYGIHGVSFEIFAACGEVVTLNKLSARFGDLREMKIRDELDKLLSDGLIFQDGSRLVRTAVHAAAV